MSARIRNLHRTTGRPDCPLCLDEILNFGLSLSKDCATLEVENNNVVRKRLVKKFRELELMAKEVKDRLRFEIAEEVKDDIRKRVHSPGHPQTLVSFRGDK